MLSYYYVTSTTFSILLMSEFYTKRTNKSTGPSIQLTESPARPQSAVVTDATPFFHGPRLNSDQLIWIIDAILTTEAIYCVNMMNRGTLCSFFFQCHWPFLYPRYVLLQIQWNISERAKASENTVNSVSYTQTELYKILQIQIIQELGYAHDIRYFSYYWNIFHLLTDKSFRF